MRIAITGGAGFVGSNLAVKLKEKYPEYVITCLDNLKRRGSELNLMRLKEHGINFVHTDIRIIEDLDKIKSFDCLIDASAEPSVHAGITSSVREVINNNFLGTLNCLELADKYEASFIFLSTSRVYPIHGIESLNFIEKETRFEWTNNQKVPGISSNGIAEKFPLEGSRSFYGMTKLASELLIQEYIKFKGLKAVINRCGVISGPYQMGKVDQGFVVHWVARHFWNGKLQYFGYGGNGKQVRDILHIFDFFRLIDWQIHNINVINGETFNVGGGKSSSVSLQELTVLCEKANGNKIPIHGLDENSGEDIRLYVTDNSKVTNMTGWSPRHIPSEIVEDILVWLRKDQNKLKQIFN